MKFLLLLALAGAGLLGCAYRYWTTIRAEARRREQDDRDHPGDRPIPRSPLIFDSFAIAGIAIGGVLLLAAAVWTAIE